MRGYDLVAALGVALGFFLGIVGHSVAHARASVALGDKTPILMGRVSISPKRHIDTLGSIIMPAIFTVAAFFGTIFQPMFGWPKQHSYNPSALRNPRRDVILVALAGPGATLIIAVVAGVVARVTAGKNDYIHSLALYVALVNSFITVIELLPIPGRDGGRILMRFLSPSAAYRFDELAQYEVLFLLALFLFLQPVVNNMVAPLFDAIRGKTL
jgi:Zn-dependent protease